MSLPGVAPHLNGTEPARDQRVRALVNGRVTSTGTYKLLLAALAVPFLAVPALLVGLAATQPSSGPQADTARPAQLISAACLVALGLLVAWRVGRSGATVTAEGIVRRWGGRTVLVRWEHISGFAASAQRRPGVWVLQVGESPLRVPTPWHRLSYPAAKDAADQLHRACGFAPPPTFAAGMRYGNGPRPRELGAGRRGRPRAAAHPHGERPVVAGGDLDGADVGPTRAVAPRHSLCAGGGAEQWRYVALGPAGLGGHSLRPLRRRAGAGRRHELARE